MKTIHGTYLGRAGKVFGPFTAEELTTLRDSGEISRYQWIWDESLSEWKPLELPPPSPYSKPEASAEWNWERLEAICHDSEMLIEGRLDNISQTGCDFVTAAVGQIWPLYHPVTLNLYDPSSRRCRSVLAQLTSIKKEPGQEKELVLQMRWKRIPA